MRPAMPWRVSGFVDESTRAGLHADESSDFSNNFKESLRT
jgi:hypothetical protein